MRYPLFLYGLLASFWLQAQVSPEGHQYESFILDYKIPTTLPADQQARAYTLKAQITLLTQQDPEAFTLDDYLEGLTFLLLVNELPENIDIGLNRILRAEGGCAYLQKMEVVISKNELYQPIRQDWQYKARECQQEENAAALPNVYRNQLTPLQIKFEQIQGVGDVPLTDDTNPFAGGMDVIEDEHNRQIIDELYKTHGKYIGRDMVGILYENHMWSGITQSSADYIERYLPILREAVLERQLRLSAFQRTLDRYCFLTTGAHLYASFATMGARVVDEAVRKRIEERYGL